MLKKILILSFRNPFNYGAELQVFSLCKKLRMLGYDAEVLDLARPGFDTDARDSRKLQIAYNSSFKHRCIEKLRFFKHRLFWAVHWKRTGKKIRNSEEFHTKYNNFTKHRYRNFDELYIMPLDYTHYIVGCDQVWNFEYPFPLDPYFLSFVKNGKKIAYAASIGHSELPERLKDYYRKHLQTIEAISMRELQGSAIVSEQLGRPVETMLDPTILITPEEWRKIFDIENKPNNAVVMYLCSYRPYAIELAKEMARRNGLKKIIYITTEVKYSFKDPEVECRFDVSAPEFVSLFANASFVITNSFHGTAFAVNLGKRFFTVVNDRMKTSSRFYSLLEQTGLLERICKEGTPLDTVVDNPIPVAEVRERLDALRGNALDFIETALR